MPLEAWGSCGFLDLVLGDGFGPAPGRGFDLQETCRPPTSLPILWPWLSRARAWRPPLESIRWYTSAGLVVLLGNLICSLPAAGQSAAPAQPRPGGTGGAQPADADRWWQGLPAPRGWSDQPDPAPPGAAPAAAQQPQASPAAQQPHASPAAQKPQASPAAPAAPPPQQPLFPPPQQPLFPPPLEVQRPRPGVRSVPPTPASTPAPAATPARPPASPSWYDEPEFDEAPEDGGWQVPPHVGREGRAVRSEPAPSSSLLGSRLFAELHGTAGWLTGLAARGYDISSPGYGLSLGWRFLRHFALEADLERPSAALAEPIPQPLTGQSSMSYRDGGARVYLTGEGRVSPWFGLGYAAFSLQTVYSLDEQLESIRVGELSLSGDALRLSCGLEVELGRWPLLGRPLTLAVAASARYLLARWDELYCFDEPLLVGADGSPRRCAYENEGGAFGRSDLILASLGLFLSY